MRVRFEKFAHGLGMGVQAECDLSPKQANKLFDKLCKDATCGWCELVAEDDDEGGYMEIIKEHSNVRLAKIITSLI